MTSLVIVNPRAGRGVGNDLETALAKHGLDAAIAFTQRPGHGTELAAQARREGADLVVAAGGDGTIHEVVNGLLAGGSVESSGPMPDLGVLPLGSGCDYAKTFDIPQDLDAAIRHLAAAPPRPVDAAELVYHEGTAEKRRFFANIAEVGIGGSCVARASKLPRFLGPAMYGIAFVLTLPGFKGHAAKITMDGETYIGPLTDLVVATGRVFGGGMRVAPNADPADGLFDVQIHFGTKIDYVRGLPKVYKGTHIPHPRIQETRVRTVEIGCDPVGLIEADGEVLGHTPATFRVLPHALSLKA